MKYTLDEVRKQFEDKNYIPMFNEYNNVMEKLPYICNKHIEQGIQSIAFSKLKAGRGCYYCGRERTVLARRNLVSTEQCIELCSSHNFIYIDKFYKGGALVIQFLCQKHIELGLQEMKYQNMKRDLKGCQYCSSKNLPKWYVLDKIEEVNPNVEILDSYINLTTRMKCRCKIHNVYSNKTAQEILDGKGCVECGKEKLAYFRTLSQEEFEQKVYENNPHIKIRSKYQSHGDNVDVECINCGTIWSQNAAVIMYSERLCPMCKGYKGEVEIAKYLTKHGIVYQPQYRFNDCKDKRSLPFDFGITNKKAELLCLIEYDGIQHFEPVAIMGMSEDKKYEVYETTVKHDKIKNDYCKDNNIPLIRIPYWERDNGTMFDTLHKKLFELNIIK